MRSLFNDQSSLDTFGFTELHEASLGISTKSFSNLLSCSPRTIVDQLDAERRSTLSWAAQRGDLEMIRQLLSHGADPNLADEGGKTPLHWAAYKGEFFSLETLLDAGAEINKRDHRGRTALVIAIHNCDNVNVLKLLLDRGADVASEDSTGCAVIHFAALHDRPNALAYLVERGGDINIEDHLGNTPLANAILNQSHRALESLLARKEFDPTHIGSLYGGTILHVAAWASGLPALTLLCATTLRRVDVQKKNSSGWTALQIAQFRRDRNETWSQEALQPPDEDPAKWYVAFLEVLDSIVGPGIESSFPPQSRAE